MIGILKRVPVVQKWVQSRLQKQSQFYMKNRQFVLQSYRYLLKTIPTIYSRRLQQKQKLNQLQYIFRSQRVHQTFQQTKFKSQRLKQIVDSVKDKNYQHLGEYQIALHTEPREIMHQLSEYNKKYSLDKREH